VSRVLRDLSTDDNLLIGIGRDRCFKEVFSDLPVLHE
jgi:hypothetical protein